MVLLLILEIESICGSSSSILF